MISSNADDMDRIPYPPAHGANSNGYGPPHGYGQRALESRDDEEESSGIQNLASLLSAVRRAWRVALPLAVLFCVAGAAAAWFVFTPKFAASAYLRIDADNRPLIFKTADEAASRASDFKLYKNTHQQLLITPFVLNAALRNDELKALPEINTQPDPIFWLQKSLVVKYPGDGEIMQITLETESPTACVKIINGVVDAFMQEVVMNERNDRLTRLNNLERVYAEAEVKVRNKRSELKSLASSLGTSDTESLTVAQQAALQQFGSMQEKLGDVQFQLMQAEGELKVAKEHEVAGAVASEEKAPVDLNQAELDRLIALAERGPEIRQLEEDIALSKAKLASFNSNFGPSHPAMKGLLGEIKTKESMLQQRRREAKTRTEIDYENKAELAATKTFQSKYDLAGMTARVETLKNQEKIMQEKVDQMAAETRQLGKSSIDVELMRSEIEGLEEVLRRVGEEIERTSIELKTSSRIKLLSSAVTATPPDQLKRYIRIAAVSGAGFFAPFFLLAVWDLSKRHVNNADSVSQELSMPIIGSLPRVSSKTLRDQVEVDFTEESMERERHRSEVELAESVDALSSMLMRGASIQGKKAYMVSSAKPGEGKSTVSCLLAKSLARAGKRVALVDFDLRRPSVHEYMNLHAEPGVTEVLLGVKTPKDVAQKTEVTGLDVITAGHWFGNLQERCNAGVVASFFETLRRDYDLVIVDSGPVLPIHDSLLMSVYVDGVVMTVIRDRSRLNELKKACERLKNYGATIVGTVIIGEKRPGYYSYYRGYARPRSTSPQLLTSK